MARNRLEYKGLKKPRKDRTLVEEPFDRLSSPEKTDTLPEAPDERQEAIDNILRDTARAFIKGNVVKDGLAGMNPADHIPIIEDDSKVAQAAIRLDEEQSNNGTIITYGMFQKCVDDILGTKWDLRKKYLNIEAPTTTYSSHRETIGTSDEDSFIEDLIKEFLAENSIASILIGVFTMSPFQSAIFQSFGVENAAKGVHALQIPVGLAILIELGIKAEMIYDFVKNSDLNFALVEEQMDRLVNSPEERRKALSSAGINYDKLKDGMKQNDCETIIDYFNAYYTKTGGLLEENSHITLDHWVAYLQVAQNQQYLRSALNASDKFSEEFLNMKHPDRNNDPFIGGDGVVSNSLDNSGSVKMHISYAATLRELNSTSNTIYDEIVSTFMYQLTDQNMCCLVEIFGAFRETELLRTIAILLRIMATDLSGNIAYVLNVFRRALQKVLQDALFELMAQLNEVYDKIQSKIQEAFTIEIEGLENCVGLLTIGFALSQSARILYQQMSWMVRDLMQLLTEYGDIEKGSWGVAADRRHLVGMAKILDVLATRLEIANICDDEGEVNRVAIDGQEQKDRAAAQVITTVLERPSPSIQITDEQLSKYFSDLEPRTSDLLKFDYGINIDRESIDQDNAANDDNCSGRISKEEINKLIEQLQKNINKTFKQ